MLILRTYLNKLTEQEKSGFAARCNTSVGYLRKAISRGHQFGEPLCVALERESAGAIPCEAMRPDLVWVRVADPDWPNPHGRPLVDHTVVAHPIKKILTTTRAQLGLAEPEGV